MQFTLMTTVLGLAATATVSFPGLTDSDGSLVTAGPPELD